MHSPSSFAGISPQFRRFLCSCLGIVLAITAFGAESAPRRVALVTGSTDGLGRVVALRLAQTGAHVIVHGRNRERGEAVVREIEAGGIGSARFYPADFASLAQVNALADQISRDHDRLDILVNNAGIWLNSGNQRQLSEDGQELHFAVNYLAGYSLTRQLLPLLRAAGTARIVNVASAAQSPLDPTDMTLAQGYSDSRGYSTSKLAQVMFTFDLAEELAGTGISVFALHPSTFMDTNMVTSRGSTPRSSVEDGADAVIHLIEANGLESGQYFNVQTPARANAQAYDRAARVFLKGYSNNRVAASRRPATE
jgi:NAD(P)-dependent dehydrogenase (short-subunit alcohol dehydrogenase family)